MTEPSDARGGDTLVRAIGVRTLAANVVNYTVGSGIFVLPGAIAAILGPAALVAYVVCATAMGLVALCLAEAGSRVSAPGGVYAYVEAAFGPLAGFLAGTLLYFSIVAASAALATVLAGSVAGAIPSADGGIARAAAIVALFGTLAAINVRGVRAGSRVMEGLTAAKLAPLVLLVVAGAFVLRPTELGWSGMPPAHDIGRASLLLIFAFVGLEAPLTSSGEVRDPARTVPRAVLLGLGVITLLYVSLQLASQGVLGAALATGTETPLADLGARVLGSGGGRLVLAAMTISILGYLSGDMLAAPRLLHAFGRDGLLPARVGAVHARFRTPHVAIACHAGICSLVALTGTFEVLLVMTTVSTLLLYLTCCIALLELRRRDVRADGAPFRVPGGPIVPILACGVVVWLLTTARREEYLAVGLALAAATLLHRVRRGRPAPADPSKAVAPLR